ncbi:hypothetical protein LAZ67_1000942 [Cordylochernes scorpioides]|uniref:Reverse transcriptase domain-containing protein n=1 Tax=Cordylochernes scorpioides TaxID=51811 RepID=A0ABY6JXI5_9ARAC|nr:hypothetical protein LAZ67_1000942 [Cordylochernes scorpioides]
MFPMLNSLIENIANFINCKSSRAESQKKMVTLIQNDLMDFMKILPQNLELINLNKNLEYNAKSQKEMIEDMKIDFGERMEALVKETREMMEENNSKIDYKLKNLMEKNERTYSQVLKTNTSSQIANKEPLQKLMGKIIVEGKAPENIGIITYVKKNISLKMLEIERENITPNKNGCTIEVPTKENAEKMIGYMKESETLNKTLKPRIPRDRIPTIKIFNIEEEFTKEDLIDYVKESLQLNEYTINPFSSRKNKYNKIDWLCSIDPKSFAELKKKSVMENGILRLKFGWRTLKWEEIFLVNRCTKCLDFHKTRGCEIEEKTCGNCGEKDHLSKDCKKEAECVNCRRANGRNPALKLEVKHNALSFKCPSYLHRAPGPDGIMRNPIYFLFKLFPQILVNLYNACLKLGYFPQRWKISRIIFLRKPNKNPSNINSIRPISLLNILGKILDKIVCESSNLSKFQYGFRWGKSGPDMLHEVISLVRDNRRIGKHLILLTIDIEGAFDNASYDIIIKSAKKLKIPSYIINLYIGFLKTERYFQIFHLKLEMNHSILEKAARRAVIVVPFYVFDIVDNYNTKIFAYADDLVLFCTENSRAKIEKLEMKILKKYHPGSGIIN